MSDNNVKISFRVSGTELSSYLNEIQRKSTEITNSAISGAIEQTKKGKEQLSIINDQIKALEKKRRLEIEAARSILISNTNSSLTQHRDFFEARKNEIFSNDKISEKEKGLKLFAVENSEKATTNRIKDGSREELSTLRENARNLKLQVSLAKEAIDAIKQTAKENVKAIMSGDMRLADVIGKASTDEEKLIAQLTQEQLKNEKKKAQREGNDGKGNIFSSMLGVDSFNKLISAAGQMGQTKDGFDLIQPASNMAGRVIGGIIGGLVGTLISPGAGTAGGAAIGSSLGGEVGDTLGAYKTQEAITKQEYYKSANRYEATTGTSVEGQKITDMSETGISVTDFLNMRTEMSKRRGESKDSDKTARDAVYLEKGYGVDQGTSSAIVEMQRSSKDNNRDLALLIGGVIEKGQGKIFKNGDNSFLNEFLGKFISLQKELLKTQTRVSSGTTMDILTKFNSVGGEFAARDSRSQGNIGAVQEGLANPASDNLKALSFSVLRKTMPNASTFDILKEREKGLSSPKYLKGMLGAVEEMGGDASQQKLNLHGMFPKLSLSAVERIFDNKKSLMSGDMSIENLQSRYKDDFKEKAENNTTTQEKNAATVTNSILGGNSAEGMMNAFTSAIKESLGGAVIELNNGQGKIKLGKQSVSGNKTKMPYNSSGSQTSESDIKAAAEAWGQ